MPFQPSLHDALNIDGLRYTVAEHPAAPGVAYGQEGRAGFVFQLHGPDRSLHALKVFKPRFQTPALVGLTERITRYADLSGLQACRRIVLTARRQRDLVRQHLDLNYAVLMPWVAGPTWMEVVARKLALSPERSLKLASAFLDLLAEMEERGLAHCDLSGPNLMLPALAESPGPAVALVDLEQMYGPGLDRPDLLPGGSPGYAHKTAPSGLWSAHADRFAGVILLAEMLGWCDERVRQAAWGESYFSPEEIQTDSSRHRTLVTVLRQHWGDGIATLLESAWTSDSLTECPNFGAWLARLPQDVPIVVAMPETGAQPERPTEDAAASSKPTTVNRNETAAQDAAHAILETAHRLEAEGDWKAALQAYQQALTLAPTGGLRDEIALIIQELEQRAPPRSTPATDELASLFDDGLAAYQRGEWAKARELLSDAVRRQPVYARGGQRAATLLAEAEKRAAARKQQRLLPVWVWTLITLGIVGVLGVSISLGITSRNLRAVTPIDRVVVLGPTEAISPTPTSAPPTHTMAPTADPASTPTRVQTPTPASKVISSTNAAAIIQLRTIGNATSAENVVFSPDSSKFASGGFDTIQLWQSSTGQLLRTFDKTSRVNALAYSPDGKLLASANGDVSIGNYNVNLWDIATGQKVRTLKGHIFPVLTVAFSPDGHILASGSQDATIRLWDPETGQILRRLDGHANWVNSVAFSPDGKLLASGDRDGVIRLWDLSNGQVLLTLNAHKHGVFAVAFCPAGDKSLLVSTGIDETIRVWSTRSGDLVQTLTGYSPSVAFSPDGYILATTVGFLQNKLNLWNTGDWQLLRTIENPSGWVEGMAFSPNGEMMALSSNNVVIDLWGIEP